MNPAPADAPLPAQPGAGSDAQPARRRLPSFPLSVLAATLAGVALLVAFPPYGLWWIAPVGVALLTLATHPRRGPARPGPRAAAPAVVFTPLLHLAHTHA